MYFLQESGGFNKKFEYIKPCLPVYFGKKWNEMIESIVYLCDKYICEILVLVLLYTAYWFPLPNHMKYAFPVL